MDLVYGYDGKWNARTVAHIVVDMAHEINTTSWGAVSFDHVMISACGKRLPKDWGAKMNYHPREVCKHCLRKIEQEKENG